MTVTLASAAKWSRVVTSGFVGCFLLAVSSPAQDAPSTSVAEAQRIVLQAAQHGAAWTGPQQGPSASSGKSIAFIAEDLRNGGILGVAQGVREAAKVLGWTVKLFDAGGTASGRGKAFDSALAGAPDGVVLSGVDALENARSLARFAERRIPVVGWHVGPASGPIVQAGVAENVTTDPLQVARVTAMAAIAQSNGRAGVVIFTDSRYGIATAKAQTMAAVIRACEKCTLLETQDVPLSEIEARIPVVTRELLQRYGMKWTHALAINDSVFDYAVPALTQAGVKGDRLSLLSAGDGSASAFLRIQAGTFQTGTVAEPLNLQGWQVMDELNRQFAHAARSGFVAPVHLVTAENLAYEGGTRLQYDPEHGYRLAYRRIWGR